MRRWCAQALSRAFWRSSQRSVASAWPACRQALRAQVLVAGIVEHALEVAGGATAHVAA
jgi:hypothetical protein